MSERVTVFSIVIALLVLAAALRFYDLGAWPYSGDETSTLHEEQVLFHAVSAPRESQAYRLPHVIPLSYLAFHVSLTLFGDNEWGSRVVVALLGCLSVALVFVCLDGPMSRAAAIVAAVLVALMPEHVMHSQETRFYMVAAFFAFASLLAGARILGPRRAFFSTVACCLIFLAVLSHTFLLVLLPLILVAVIAGCYAEKRPVPRSVWVVFAVAAASMTIFFALYLWPLLHGWNQHESWGYSPIHAILASIVMIGWPTTLLVVIGCALMLRERASAQNWYWLVCFVGWVGATVTLPLVVPYHPEYVFPLALSGLVIAAYVIALIYDLLRTRAPLARTIREG